MNDKWVALVVTPDGTGTVETLTFADCQSRVGGYVEIIPSGSITVDEQHVNVLVNEEGSLIGLVHNPFATFLTGKATGWLQDVVGTAVFVGDAGENFADLSPGALNTLREALAQIQTM